MSERQPPAPGKGSRVLPLLGSLALSLLTALVFLGVLEGGSRLLERARPAPDVAMPGAR